jgi:hypothetical protein
LKSDLTASIAWAYRRSASKISLSVINSHYLPGLDRWLKHKQRLRKLGKKPGIQRVKRQSIGSRKPPENDP